MLAEHIVVGANKIAQFETNFRQSNSMADRLAAATKAAWDSSQVVLRRWKWSFHSTKDCGEYFGHLMQPKSTKSDSLGASTISCVCSDLRCACMSSKPRLGNVAEHILQINKRISFGITLFFFSTVALATPFAMLEFVGFEVDSSVMQHMAAHLVQYSS